MMKWWMHVQRHRCCIYDYEFQTISFMIFEYLLSFVYIEYSFYDINALVL